MKQNLQEKKEKQKDCIKSKYFFFNIINNEKEINIKVGNNKFFYDKLIQLIIIYLLITKSKEDYTNEVTLTINGIGNQSILWDVFYRNYQPNVILVNEINYANINFYIIINENTKINKVTIKWNKIIEYCDGIFAGYNNITQIDFSKFDTSYCKTMRWVFCDCYYLTSLDLSHFDVSLVQGMDAMFKNCISLTSLDLSNFDTSSVITMVDMFGYCKNLKTLIVNRINTSKVNTMRGMFEGLYNLTSLDISNFDTSLVTDISYMFQNCYELTEINLSNFITNKV